MTRTHLRHDKLLACCADTEIRTLSKVSGRQIHRSGGDGLTARPADEFLFQQSKKMANTVQTSSKLMFAAILLPLVVTTTQSIASDIDHESRDRPRLLDPTCERLNSVYKRMREQSLYRETIFELRADGTRQERITLIFHDDYVYQKATDGTTWDRFNNDGPYWQSFTSCTAKKVKGAAIYYATYHKAGRIAGAEVWTTTDGETITKVVRRYPTDGRVFSFQTAVSFFDYRQNAIKVPKRYTCGGAPCRY